MIQPSINTEQERRHELVEMAYERLEKVERDAGFVVRPHTPRLQLKGRLVIDRREGSDAFYRWEGA